jgi:hypothetical protein
LLERRAFFGVHLSVADGNDVQHRSVGSSTMMRPFSTCALSAIINVS